MKISITNLVANREDADKIMDIIFEQIEKNLLKQKNPILYGGLTITYDGH